MQADIMFDGYLGDAAKTAESFGPHGFRTGDLGRRDGAGYVYVTGRVKDLIISGDMNVYPAEVEAALAALPGVAECAVIGLPDERWGEAVTAMIVPAPGAGLTQDSAIAHVRDPDRQLQATAAGAFRRRAATQREHEGTKGPTARRPDPERVTGQAPRAKSFYN